MLRVFGWLGSFFLLIVIGIFFVLRQPPTIMKFSSSALLLAAVASTASAFAPAALRPTSLSSALKAGEVLESTTGQSQLDPTVIAKYNSLPYPADTILAEYVWVDAEGSTRSKTRTLPKSKVRACVCASVCVTVCL